MTHKPHPLLVYGTFGFSAGFVFSHYPVISIILFFMLIWMIISKSISE